MSMLSVCLSIFKNQNNIFVSMNMMNHQRTHGAHGVSLCPFRAFQAVQVAVWQNCLELTRPEPSFWSPPRRSAAGATSRQLPQQGMGKVRVHHMSAPTGWRVPSCSLETKANQQKLLGENIPKYLQTLMLILLIFLQHGPYNQNQQAPCVHWCTTVHPQRPSSARLSWHHATTHTTTATLLNGFLEAGDRSSWHPKHGWNFIMWV